MKRLIVVVLTLALCIAAGSAALAAKSDTVKVRSKITLKYQTTGTPPYAEGSRFYGKVKGKKAPAKYKKKCKKNRKVKVSGVGETKTAANGKYELFLDRRAAPGTYTAKVKKKTVHKKGVKIVCKKAKKSLTIS